MGVRNLRLASLGGSSRVAGSHGAGGDRECPAGGRTGELGDGLAKHLVDGVGESWDEIEDRCSVKYPDTIDLDY